MNPSVKWSYDLINKFKERIDYSNLATNINVEWNQSLIEKTIELDGFDLLGENSGVWNYLKYDNKQILIK